MNALSFVLIAVLAVACSAQQAARQPAILQYSSELTQDGGFQYGFQTEDGISSEARGTVLNAPDNQLVNSVSGQYSYTGPDNQVYTVTYVADGNGYRASGAHLPQAPAVPEAIQRAVAQNLQQEQQQTTYQQTTQQQRSQVQAFQQQQPQQAYQAFQQRSQVQAFQQQQPQQVYQAFQPQQAYQAFQQRSQAPSTQFQQAFQQQQQQVFQPQQHFQQRSQTF